MSEVLAFLSRVEDVREQDKIIYPLSSLLFMSICAIFVVQKVGMIWLYSLNHEKDWLSNYIDMSPGIPCYSTFRRVFSVIDPSSWSALIEGTLGIVIKEKAPEEQIPIDGKTLRGTRCSSKGIRAIQMVSAWSVSNKISLADIRTDSKSNEIKRFPCFLIYLQ
ncbi:Transposase IS4 family protein [Legionella feeleii]|uniref:Transposase IS4 family protein n=1 Tax=Legionella feeleii TaxID=453 RepID=A0A2X1SZR9_9GAMM|nr:Transposase IS4 family protein [Legionella feeleii]